MEDESQPRIDLVSCADKGIRNVSLTFFSCKKQDTFQHFCEFLRELCMDLDGKKREVYLVGWYL